MADGDRERDRAWRRAQAEVLRRRIRLQTDTHAEIQRLLAQALKDIQAALAGAPSDFQAWYLPQLQAEIERVLKAAGQQAAGTLGAAADESWWLGVASIDAPMAAAGVRVAGVLPHLDTGQLAAMRAFMTDRIRDVSASAINRINTELGLTLIGARPMPETIGQLQSILGGASRTRATTIVRTELSRAYSVASDGRARQAAAAGVEMDKVWRRSGKRHPRVSHALADGQRVAVGQPFLVGGVRLMYPHDPAAPAAHTINCGCVALYRPRGWASTRPDHRPFTDEELALNPKLAAAAEARESGRSIHAPKVTAAPPPIGGAFAAARAGGTHAGFLGNYYDLPAHLVRKGIRSIEKQIANHEAWIADPVIKLKHLAEMNPEQVRRYVEEKWPADVQRQREHVDILKGILKEREDGKQG